MGATASPSAGAGPANPAHLTFSYTENDDGWITAQIVEFPAAISQGPTYEDAMMNALEALHDLTHTPTFAERLAFIVQAQLIEPLDELRHRLVAGASRTHHHHAT